MKPGDASQIEMIEGVLILEACMVQCEKDIDCESFVYEDTTRRCFMYSTAVGIMSMINGHKAVNKLVDRCIRITRPGNILFYKSDNSQ